MQSNYTDARLKHFQIKFYLLSFNLKVWLTKSIFKHAQLNFTNHLLYIFIPISACQKSTSFINSYLTYSWFKNSVNWLTNNFFNLTKLKLSIHVLSSFNLSMLKITTWLTKLNWDIVDSRISKFDCQKAFLKKKIKKIYNYLDLYLNLYLHAKNHVDSSILTRDWRILQYDWPTAFLTLPNQKFSNNPLSFFPLFQHAKNHADLPSCF